MSKQTIITITCDMTGDNVTVADEKIHFSIDGKAYEMDVTAAWAAKFREDVAPYVKAARKASGGSARRSSGSQSSSSGTVVSMADREHNRKMREVLREHGVKVSDRGRISDAQREAYEAIVARGVDSTPADAPEAPTEDVSATEDTSPVESSGESIKITNLSDKNVDAVRGVTGVTVIEYSKSTVTLSGGVAANRDALAAAMSADGRLSAVVDKLTDEGKIAKFVKVAG